VRFVDDDYKAQWIVDNLPAATKEYDPNNPGVIFFGRGFKIGFRDDSGADVAYYIYNHVRIKIMHTQPNEDGEHLIVGFEVEPFSKRHTWNVFEEFSENVQLDSCNANNPIAMDDRDFQRIDEEIVFTYDVVWMESDVNWANRWDMYLTGNNPDQQIHWFSIINSLMIVIFLTAMVAMIMLRTLHRDISKYNELQTAEEVHEESGWKLVHADVFRPPEYSPMLFAVFAGTGVHVISIVVLTMAFALLGFLSPANRGGLMTSVLMLFVFLGSFAGYFSASLYKTFGGKDWKKNTLLTAMLLPGTCFSMFFVLNLFIWKDGSSAAVPFTTLVSLVVLWFGVSMPLVFVGSYFGFKREPYEYPVRTHLIARQIPEQVWYMNPWFTPIVGGVLPFGAVFIELFFILSAVWLHQIYYLFGFLAIVLAILAVTCAEVTIVMCYFQLCSEDYRWWWRSFLTSGSSALYLYIYSGVYFFTKLDITFYISTMVYFGYMFLIAVGFFFMTGAFGFYACFWFTRTIYGAVKVD